MTWKKTSLNFYRQCLIGKSSVYIIMKRISMTCKHNLYVVLDRTVSLFSSIALTDIEQDRIEWESLASAFAEVMWAIENHLKTLAVKPSSISRRKNSQSGKSEGTQFCITSITRSALQKVQPCQEES